MNNFTGTLSVNDRQSSLPDGNGMRLITLAGTQGLTEAAFAATRFLLETRHLRAGQSITVMGERGTVDGVSVIVMVDAQAANLSPQF